jgi:curved DNA-binding protein CbpA
LKDYNYYKLFNISESATIDQINKAHKLLVSIYHSDKTGGGDGMIKLINHAKVILCDPAKRRAHDAFVREEDRDRRKQSYNTNNDNTSSSTQTEILRPEIERLKLVIQKKNTEIERLKLVIQGKNAEIERQKLVTSKKTSEMERLRLNIQEYKTTIDLLNIELEKERERSIADYMRKLDAESESEKNKRTNGCLFALGAPLLVVGLLLFVMAIFIEGSFMQFILGVICIALGCIFLYAARGKQ